MNFSHSILTALFLFLFASSAFAGDIKGQVKFSGSVPAPVKLDMSSDPACAAQGGSGEADEVITSADGGLKNVFVYVLDGVQGNFEVPKEAVQLDQKGCRYQPHVLGVQVGQSVEIINSDSTLHNVHGMPSANKQFNSGMPFKGMKIKKKFEKPEVMFKLKCDVHPWMSAYIGVLTHPFFTVTGDDGKFEIKNLPPGNYTIAAWHEKFGISIHKVEVTEAEIPPIDFAFSE